jgi:hypothetical protein
LDDDRIPEVRIAQEAEDGFSERMAASELFQEGIYTLLLLRARGPPWPLRPTIADLLPCEFAALCVDVDLSKVEGLLAEHRLLLEKPALILRVLDQGFKGRLLPSP